MIYHKESWRAEEKAGVGDGQVQEVGGEGVPADAEAEEPEDGRVPHQPAQADEQRDATGDDFRDMFCEAPGPIVSIPIDRALRRCWGHCIPVMDHVVGVLSVSLLSLLCSPGERQEIKAKLVTLGSPVLWTPSGHSVFPLLHEPQHLPPREL